MRHRSTRSVALVADQALYSGSNFVFVLAQSRRSDAAAFSNFAAASALLVLLVALGRYLFHEPAMAGAVPVRPRIVGVALRGEWVYWAAATASIITVSAMVLGSGAVGIACIAPFVLAQDQRRYALFSTGAASLAVAADAVWAVAVLPMLVIGTGVDARSVWWGLAAGLSWLVTWVPTTRTTPSPLPARTSAPRRYMVIDFLINELSVPIGLVLLARSSRADSAAEFRVVLIPFGVLWVAVGALRSLGIAEHRRLADDARRRRARVISLAAAGLAVAMWAVLELVGASTWSRLIGPSWPTSGLIVTFAGILHVAKAAQTGALLDLKAAARFRTVSGVRVACGLAPMLVAWAAAVSGSAGTVMAALAVGEILTVIALAAITTQRLPARVRVALAGDGG